MWPELACLDLHSLGMDPDWGYEGMEKGQTTNRHMYKKARIGWEAQSDEETPATQKLGALILYHRASEEAGLSYRAGMGR